MTLTEIQNKKKKAMDTLLDECGVFFAFSNSQFDEGMQKVGLSEASQVVSIGMGGFATASGAKKFHDGMIKANEEFTADLVNNNLRDDYILYELLNHEAFYTWRIDDTLDALGEGYTTDEVMAVFTKNKSKYND